MNENIKFIALGMVSFAIISLIGYIATTTVLMLLFFVLLIVVCWNLGIIVQDIINGTQNGN